MSACNLRMKTQSSMGRKRCSVTMERVLLWVPPFPSVVSETIDSKRISTDAYAVDTQLDEDKLFSCRVVDESRILKRVR